jgi:hypothetical protein
MEKFLTCVGFFPLRQLIRLEKSDVSLREGELKLEEFLN